LGSTLTFEQAHLYLHDNDFTMVPVLVQSRWDNAIENLHSGG